MLERNRNQRVARCGSYASVTIITRSCHDADVGTRSGGSPLQGI